MLRFNSTTVTLLIAAAVAAGVGFGANEWADARKRDLIKDTAASVSEPAAPKQSWLASAPGRVEPKSGEVRMTAQVPGRIAAVLSRANDRVQAGDLLVRLDDEEPQARLVAAQAEAAVRRRERDAETVAKPAQDRRNAEDAVAFAERAVHAARTEFDRVYEKAQKGQGTADAVSQARSALSAARDKLEQERAALARVAATSGLPAPTRLESSLTAARSDVALAEIAIERSRIRAPLDSTVLYVNAKAGEMLAPTPDNIPVTLGDVSSLRVRAEVEERDLAKIRVGLRAVVRAAAFAGREFEGKVASVAEVLGPPRLGSGPGPRKPNDIFFRSDATAQSDRPRPVQ